MKCICKLRVDELRKKLGFAQTTVISLQPILPDLSEFENLTENVSERIENAPNVSGTGLLPPIVQLSESEAQTVMAAEQLTAAANIQATLQAGLGVNMTSSTAPKALGGIIQAAQASGLISVLEMIANFKGLDPIGSTATLINSIYDKFGIDLLEEKAANDAANDSDRIAESVGNQKTPEQPKPEQSKPEKPKEGKPEDLSKKEDDELPGMIGDSVRKLNEYIKENPGISQTSLADKIIKSFGDELFIGLDDLDLDELNELIRRAQQSVKRDFAVDTAPVGKEPRPSYWLFTTFDFIDFRNFALRMKDATDPVSLFLKDQMEQSVRDTLTAYDGSIEFLEEVRSPLINTFNQVLQGGVSLYDETRFAGVTLRQKTKDLLAESKKPEDQQNNDLIRLNRYLIEDAYPDEIYIGGKNDYGCLLFSRYDFSDFGSLALKLRNGADPVSLFFRNELDRTTLELLKTYDNSVDPSIKLRNGLVDGINKIIQRGSSIYDEVRFAGIKLSKKTEKYLKEVQQGPENQKEKNLILLNRNLVEDAYPEETGNGEEHKISYVELNKVVDEMVEHDLSGRIWDQEQKAREAFEKLEELERLRAEKLKEELEKQKQKEAKKDDSLTEKQLENALIGEEKEKASEEQEGSTLFSKDDYIDFKRLASKLKNPPEPVSQFLSTQSQQSTRDLLNVYESSAAPSEALQNALLSELNKVIQMGASIYEETRFAGVTLRRKTQELKDQNPQGDNLIRLNRHLIEDAYPQEIANNKAHLTTLVKKSDSATKRAVSSSVKASNSAVRAANNLDLFLLKHQANPQLSAETISMLKELSDSSIKSALLSSEAMTKSLKAMKEAMAYVEAGDLEKAKEAIKLAQQYATEAEAARIRAYHAEQRLALMINTIDSAVDADDHSADAADGSPDTATNAGGSAEPETTDDPVERERVVKAAVDSADKSSQAFGGNITSPTGLTITARSIAAININGPALTMVNSMVSTEMLLRALANLHIFLLLKDVFGDNLLGPSGGSSIATSLGYAAGAAAGTSGAASPPGGATGGAGAGGSAGGSAGAGGGALASVSAGLSAGAVAGLNGMSGMLANTPPSPLAILLLTCILTQLKTLGHDVVACSPCRLSLQAMSGKNESTGGDSGYDKNEKHDEQFDEKDTEDHSNSGGDKSSDVFSVMKNLKLWLRSTNQSTATMKLALTKAASLLNMSASDLLASDELAGIPGLAKIDADDLLDLKLPSNKDLAATGGLAKNLGAESLDTMSPKLESDTGDGGEDGSKSGLGDGSDSTSNLSARMTNDSDANLQDSKAVSEKDPTQKSAEPDTGNDPSNSSNIKNASGNSGSADDTAGDSATAGNRSDDSDKAGVGKSSDSESSANALSGSKIAAGVAAGALGAVGIGAIAAATMRGGDSFAKNSSGDGNADGAESGGADNSSGSGDGESANTSGSSAPGYVVSGGANPGNLECGDSDQNPWYQKAKHSAPSRNVTDEIYAVGDPSVNQREDLERKIEDTFALDVDDKSGNTWHQRAKHDKPKPPKPDPEKDNDFDIKDIIDKASDLDDLNESSK